jgi:hypothetical protein
MVQQAHCIGNGDVTITIEVAAHGCPRQTGAGERGDEDSPDYGRSAGTGMGLSVEWSRP